MWWQLLVSVLAGLAVTWLALVVALWRARPDPDRLRQAIRLLPDVVRLLSRLARDRTLPVGLRLRLWAVLGYLALPVDLVPDFIPVIGYADDALVVALALRSVVRAAGGESLARNWPGTAAGLAAVERLAGITRAAVAPVGEDDRARG